jgi:segregation and condensation protein A
MTDAVDSAADLHGARPDLSGWEDPPRVTRRDTAPVLSVDGFQGPLDWLLEIARARKINLARLSIAALVEQFAEALAAALAGREEKQIERWAGWTVMAATLTELWSRLLLPADPAAARAAEAEAEALRRQLLARARMRQAADWLARRPQLGWDVFPRGQLDADLSGRGSDITDLLRACLLALRVPDEQAAAYRPRPPSLWRVTDAIPLMRRLLAAVPDGGLLAASCRSSMAMKPAARCAVARPSPALWSPAWNSRATAPSHSSRTRRGRPSGSGNGRTAPPAQSGKPFWPGLRRRPDWRLNRNRTTQLRQRDVAVLRVSGIGRRDPVAGSCWRRSPIRPVRESVTGLRMMAEAADCPGMPSHESWGQSRATEGTGVMHLWVPEALT